MSKRGLGKGLDALLATSSYAREKQQVATQSQALSNDGTLADLSIHQLQPGVYQPRKDMSDEALAELSASIQSQGIIQPIVVRKVAEERYEIIAGERRWRAAKQAGLKQVPCLIKNVQDRAAVAMSLIENIQREDLNAIEESQALERLQEEFQLTHQQIADVIGKSRATVSNLLRLNQLEEQVKLLVEQKSLEMGHARALLALESESQYQVAEQIVKKSLTVRQAEALVKKTLAAQQSGEKLENLPVANTTVNEETYSKLEKLQQALATKVDVKVAKNGTGNVLINFKDENQLVTVLKQLEAIVK
ncbi:ParB/RepB/Spo0J family partition protein [Vibrio agarivorans]|uniref:ParB/RepB/Spo0J family partition protein n=1 Tax=Vibrio agarivorans TaxID=153622 RepID=UPI0025B5AEB5|nr:ParB/RepB/Spo0J family partition protein [Vibrio agarivorans]MDN3661994.1 ParB/RepB/Spo0J family partition protein [Vibrio agarivorans]